MYATRWSVSNPLWDELFPAEQARIVQLLVERVDVGMDGVDIRLRTEGLANSGRGPPRYTPFTP